MLSVSTLKPGMRNTRTPPSHISYRVYTLLSATTFVVPTNHGSTVPISTPDPASAVIAALTREHTENLLAWKTCTDTDMACKQKILGLVPEVYYRTLKKKYTAYAGVTCLTLLTHLRTEYGRLTRQYIDEIDKRMKSPISGETEIKGFVQQIEDGQEAVALHNPYTDTQIVTIAENLIESTGFYTMDCRELNRTNNAQKTWVNFKVHFLRAFVKNGTSPGKHNMLAMDIQTPKIRQTQLCWRK